jgi:alkylation response protein AidB-like acyl-CoA dehydrogenase
VRDPSPGETGRAEATQRAVPPQLAIEGPGEEGWLDAEERGALTPAGLVERAYAIQALVASHAEAAERARKPVTAAWDAIRATGCFYHFVPKRYGGLEFGVEAWVDAMLPIAEACASTGWVTAFNCEHNFLAALFPEAAQDEFFAGERYIVAPGVSNPIGVAERAPGGYRVSGAYKFGSCVMHANWVLALAIIPGEDPPAPRWFALRAEEVRVLDTWYVDGMAGTGSNDIAFENAFVPEHRVLTGEDMRSGTSAGAALHSSHLFRMPAIPLLALATSIPAVGCARAAVRIQRDRMAAGRTTFASQTRQADKASAQVRLARAELLAQSAELCVRDAARRLEALGRDGDGKNAPARLRLVAQLAQSSVHARAAVAAVMEGAGASAHFAGSPLQRIHRDLHVISSHLIHDHDTIAEQLGRQMLGLEPTSAMY